MLAQLLTVVALLSSGAIAQSDIPCRPHSIEAGAVWYGNNSLYTYPTQFTQGIIPRIPLAQRLLAATPEYQRPSCRSDHIEADVWLFNGNLHIGHEQSA